MSKDVDRARELLETAKLQNISDRMLAAAQVHATLAVEAAVQNSSTSSGPAQQNGEPPTVSGPRVARNQHDMELPIPNP